MESEILQVDNLTPDEKTRLFGWSDDAFGVRKLNIKWRPDVYTRFLLKLEGEISSHIAIVKHDLLVDRRVVKVGGVGAVITVPNTQGKGCAGTLLNHVQTFLKEELKVQFGFLFCQDKLVNFYQSNGWTLVKTPVYINQPSGPIHAPLSAMILPCQSKVWPEGKVDLQSLPW